MQFKWVGQDAIPTGLTASLASVQQTITQAGSLSNTPMYYDGAKLASTTALVAPGTSWWDQQTGNAFRYVRVVTSTITPGMLVTFSPPTTGTATSAGSTVNSLITNVTTTVNEAGNYLWTLDAAGTYSFGVTPYSQSLRLIKSSTIGANATFTLAARGSIYGNNAYDPDGLPAVPTNGSALSVIRPFNVIPGTTTSAPIGVCMGECAIGSYTPIQIAGLAMVRAINTTAATVVGSPGAVLSNGVFTGGALAITGAGQILPLVAYNTATVSLIPCMVNFTGA